MQFIIKVNKNVTAQKCQFADIWLWSIHSPWLVNPRFFALLSLLINKIDPLNIRFQTHKLNNPIHRNSHTLSHLKDIFISITLICSFLRMAQNIVFFLSRSVWDRTRLARYLEDHLKPSCVSFSSPNSSDWLGKRSPDPCVHHHMCKDGKTFLSTYESLQKKKNIESTLKMIHLTWYIKAHLVFPQPSLRFHLGFLVGLYAGIKVFLHPLWFWWIAGPFQF